ncbi:hypothetical protein ABFS82_10G019300 [Erythranthe guttata]
MATFGRVMVLIWADQLALYMLWLLMAYLTDVWKPGLTHAATIVNVFWGLYAVFPLLHAFLADTILGNYWMIFISNISFSAGLGFLTMSTPPVLARSMGNCSEYSPECIGQGQKILFYTAMPLIVFGMAGHLSCTTIFYDEQLSRGGNQGNNDGGSKVFTKFFYDVANIIVPSVAVLGLPYVNPWSLRFGIPAICALVATFLFSTTLRRLNKYNLKPKGSPVTIFIRVFVAAVSKLLYTIPTDANELFEVRNSQLALLPHSGSLRCLDKAAIVIPTKPLEEQENNAWGLCRVTEVEETKTIVCMIPVWMTFIFCGVVTALVFTYFIEQLNHMNPKVGRLKVPIVAFLWLHQQITKKCANFCTRLYHSIGVRKPGSEKIAPTMGIAVSMILAILCCITAAKVENRRLGVARRHGLVDKHDERLPMTMFWLLPQFVLLGASDGVLISSGYYFFTDDQAPFAMQRYLPLYNRFVSGVGILTSILTVFVVGRISEKGGKTNWFQHSINASRVDKYYWTLAWLMGVNLVIFVVVAVLYRYKESKLKREEPRTRSRVTNNALHCGHSTSTSNWTCNITCNCCCWNFEYNS